VEDAQLISETNDLVETYFLDRISFNFLPGRKLDYPFKSDLRLVKIINLIKLPNTQNYLSLDSSETQFRIM